MISTFQPDETAPLLLFGGPYSNLEALQALFAASEARGIPPVNWLCTGDLVAYCADPRAVVDAIRTRGIAVVQGNCEESLGTDAADCGCGFAPGSACDLLASQWYRYARAALDDGRRAWMRSLPPRIVFTWRGRRFLAVHGGVHNNARFLFASQPDADYEGEVPPGSDVVLAGHCGLPFTRRLGSAIWHNPGVIGMPANDGTARTWYSTVRETSGGLAFDHHPLEYDAAAASHKMRARGLPDGYARALELGLWPSLEVLPATERAATGVALEPRTLHADTLGRGPAAAGADASGH